jgi:dihydrofolate reductase
MATHYYTACSLDGFIADGDNELDWLFTHDIDMDDGPMSYASFSTGIGAMCMGSTTYEWILAHHPWEYTLPTWIFSHRDLEPVTPDVRITQADAREVHAEMTEAAGGKDLWIVGGGELVGTFADADLLDQVWVQYPPVTLGGGAPLLPRRLDLVLEEVGRNGDFLCGRWSVKR